MTTPAQRRAESDLDQLRRRVLIDLPTIDAGHVELLLAEARADRPRTVRELNTYLATTPDGLLNPDSLCPLGLNRLALVLAAHGHGVSPPACPLCGRQVLLRHHHSAGRICDKCNGIAHPKTCTRCGKLDTASFARFGAELLCHKCYRNDPRSHRECSKCGRMRTLEQRGPNGELLCQTCAPRPVHICIDCGQQRPAQARTPDGPVCNRCYLKHQTPRQCGVCGKMAPIVIKAKNDQPDYCLSCWNREYGKRRRANRPPRPPKPPGKSKDVLQQPITPRQEKRSRPGKELQPKPPRPPKLPRFTTCSLCGRDRSITVYWPIGPICGSCYPATKERPRICAKCNNLAVLIAKDADGQLICGPCAGSKMDYRCKRCNLAGRVYSAGNCFRCCVDLRLTEVLGGSSARIPDHLLPLRDALLAAEKPRSVLVWLKKSAAAQLLSDLATEPGDLTHTMLDALPPSRAVHFVRRLLMDTGVLPERLEHLDRVTPWMQEQLATRPAAHAKLIRPYVRWQLLHRARRRAQRNGDRTGAAHALRKRIKTILEFLAWIDNQNVTLASLAQAELDRWLVGRPESYWYVIRGFLQWASSKNLAPTDLQTPTRKNGQPKNFADIEDYTQQLRRCLHDDALPVDVRAAGALILLYGLHTTDVLVLRRNQVLDRDGEHYLQLRTHALLLPPLLGVLMCQLPVRRVNRTIVQPPAQANPLLFPGFNDAQHIDSYNFGSRLIRHGITPLAGRNTARLTLAAELPAAVLADVIGIHNATAALWAHRSGRNWHGYLAARRADNPDQTPQAR